MGNTALEWGIAALDATMRTCATMIMPALGEMGEMVILARDRSIEHPVLLETLERARTVYHPVLLDQTVVKFCNLSFCHFVSLSYFLVLFNPHLTLLSSFFLQVYFLSPSPPLFLPPPVMSLIESGFQKLVCFEYAY